jgi:uncharacterized iron-regulated membrane protein
MKRLRKVIFWCHLATGVLAGIIVLIMSVTGVLLTYEKQIIAWADTRGYTVGQAAAGAARLPLEELVAKARAGREAAPSTFTLRSNPTAPVEVGFGRAGSVFLNPYTGEVLGEGAKGTRAFFQIVTDWHRWLGAQGENRAVARAITGASNLGFLFLVMSGLYLWFPQRNWTRKQFRNTAWFRRGVSGRARDFNWHNVIGFWSLIPLFIVVLSALPISYTWAGNLVYRIAGETPPAARTPPGPQDNRKAELSLDGIDRLIARSEQQVTDWRSITLQLPMKADAPVSFNIDRGNGGQPQKRAQLTLNRASGEVEKWEPFSSFSAGRQLRSIMRFAHTGEVAGIIGQTIAGLASLGAVLLVWTGLALAWRRFRSWRARRGSGSLSVGEVRANLRGEENEPLDSTA